MESWFAAAERPKWIGLDIGGANLKVADGRGRAASEPFELWRRTSDLAGALSGLIGRFDRDGTASIAATMTGELADCFVNKAAGVRALVEATVGAAARREVRFATVDDRWLAPEDAASRPEAVAAANWRVAARYLAGVDREAELWVDVGSTTTDVIRLESGRVAAHGSTDVDRLQRRELLYTGVRRTPVCAVVDALPYRGGVCPVAAEWFATTYDAWIMLGDVPEGVRGDTADGRPATRSFATARLGRCLCCDDQEFDERDGLAAAQAVADAQVRHIGEAVRANSPHASRALVSGEGDFLARRAVLRALPDCTIASVAQATNELISVCLPAHAAAALASTEGSVL